MAKSNFDWSDGQLPNVRLHSLAKLRLISDYLNRYFDTVTQQPQLDKVRITLVDGFCGGGAFTDGQTIVDGTPMRLIHAVEDAQVRISTNKTKPFALEAVYHFVDKDRDAVDHLESVLRSKGYGPRIGVDIHLYCDAFEDAYPKIKQAIQSHTQPRKGRSLFVLDQLGYTAVPTAMLRDILHSFEKSEIILTLAVDWLIDFIRRKPEDALPIGSLELEQKAVAELSLLRNQNADRKLIQELLLEKIRKTTGALFQTPFFIRSEDSKKDLWLVHLSRHFTARNVMVESHWGVKNSSWHPGKGGFDIVGFDPRLDPYTIPSFFFGEAEVLAGREQLAEDFLRRLSTVYGNGKVEYASFLASIANLTPARLLDISAVTTTLIDSKELVVESSDGQPRRTLMPNFGDKILKNPQTSFFIKRQP